MGKKSVPASAFIHTTSKIVLYKQKTNFNLIMYVN